MCALKKAKIFEVGKENDGFYVQFNPSTLDYSVGASIRGNWDIRTPGKSTGGGGSLTQGDPTAMTNQARLMVKLLYYTYTNETTYSDVRQEINRLRFYIRRTIEKENQVISRTITFAWGTITQTGTLDALSASYQMFAADGTPVQAEVSIVITGEDPDVQSKAKEWAAEVQYESDANAYRKQGKLPGSSQWLFE